MNGLILAAGMGIRLKEYTKNIPKCMVDINGETLIKRQIEALNSVEINKIIIVCGYKKEILKDYIMKNFQNNDIIFVDNDDYKTTNNIYSLFLAREYLSQDDTLLLESDLIFDNSIIKSLVEDNYKNIVAIAKYENGMNGTAVTINNNDFSINNFYYKNNFNAENIGSYYKTINIYKLDKNFCKEKYIPCLEEYINKEKKNEFYEVIFGDLLKNNNIKLKGKVYRDEKWYEIDNEQDLDIAKCIFSGKVEDYEKRYGGYWRFNNLKDFCYLENPEFPPKNLIERINHFSNELLTKYPSNIATLSLIASTVFNTKQEQIIVGNGSAELIKELGNLLDDKLTIHIPVFNEYIRCFKKCKIIKNDISKNDYFYDKETIINEIYKSDIIAIVNPDNPSGNFITHNDMIEILEIAKENSTKIIVDESFIEFADKDKRYTLLNKEVLDKYNNLIVIKSISKSYGVPGIRLGILASGDTQIINKIKDSLEIWNVNSIAEYFLQIINLYKTDYEESCNYITQQRKELYKELSKLKFLKVYKSQANYFMCKLLNCDTSYIKQYLLENYNILIKDLKNKEGFNNENYIRISIKNNEDNIELIKALKNLERNLNINDKNEGKE